MYTNFHAFIINLNNYALFWPLTSGLIKLPAISHLVCTQKGVCRCVCRGDHSATRSVCSDPIRRNKLATNSFSRRLTIRNGYRVLSVRTLIVLLVLKVGLIVIIETYVDPADRSVYK